MSAISELAPADPLMRQAWVDCLTWAAGSSDIVAAFQRDTGVHAHAPRTALDAMIDKAGGVDEIIGEKFVRWFHENVWGSEDTAAK